jgi:hypothetical protein
MPLLVNEVLDQARGAYLNDRLAERWPTDELLPYFREAWTRLEAEFLANEIKAIQADSLVLTVPPNISDLSSLLNYPTDLVVPNEVLERLPGEDDFSWMALKEGENVSKKPARDFLYEYEWTGGVLQVSKAIRTIEVYIGYIKLFTGIAGENTALFAIHAKGFLAARTAALAAGFGGGAGIRAQAIGAISDEYLTKLMAIEIKEQQNEPARHRPYRPRRL